MQRSSSLLINLSAIHHNLKCFIRNCGHVMVMVKANAYGTDSVQLAKYIHTIASKEIPFLGVSHVWEGVALREAGITLPIFVISAPPKEAEYVVSHSLTTAVSTLAEVEALNKEGEKQNKKSAVHLHLDTGMNRSGTCLRLAHQLHTKIISASHLHLDGIMSHFVAAETSNFDFFTQRQITQFKLFLESLPQLPKWIHLANTGGAARFHLPFCNLARIGLGYVGLGTSLPDMKKALSLKTHLAAIKCVNQGENVGYNCLYTVTQEHARIGVIPFGYYDGFPRGLSSKGYVLISGKKAPMIGAICMDFMMIDLSDIPEAQVGDEVNLFNEELSIEHLASLAQTDVRELLVHLSARVHRLWTHEEVPTIVRINNGYINNFSERLSNPLLAVENSTVAR
jgi:alanine racemase